MSDEPLDWKAAWYALDQDSKARIAALEAEVATLTEALRQAGNKVMAEALGDTVFGELTAEIARLRKFLGAIAEADAIGSEWCRRHARAALEAGQ